MSLDFSKSLYLVERITEVNPEAEIEHECPNCGEELEEDEDGTYCPNCGWED